MTKNKELKNPGASVRAQLLNLSRTNRRPFQELLQYFVIERFLYRLSLSSYRDRFTLKGALLFFSWKLDSYRPTIDIDLLGSTKNSKENLTRIIQEIFEVPCEEEDGIIFLKESLSLEDTQIESDYNGLRALFIASLDSARVSMQIDIGFGDIVTPEKESIIYPSLISMQNPLLLGYTPETVIAEKLETVVRRNVINSRMKDFYDIWTLSRQFSFSGSTLKLAIINTFQNRGSFIDQKLLEALFDDLKNDRATRKRWEQFLKRSRIEISPPDFGTLLGEILNFITPIVKVDDKMPVVTWSSIEGWKDGNSSV